MSENAADWGEYTSAEGMPYYYNHVTGETTWDKPSCLKGEDELDVGGNWVWIPDEVEGFIVGSITNEYNDGTITYITPENQEGEVKLKKGQKSSDLIQIYGLSSLKKLTDDLVKLESVTDPFIVHNLRERCKNGEIYTYVGDILISVNPFKRLPLYTASIMDKYHHEKNEHLPPHLFAIADDCYKSLLTRQNQSVIISGESGAGKTEATKLILQYLAEIAGSVGGVEQQVLLANPVLEAFGNAKTVRNNNSSRFGKWMECHFDRKTKIIGCKINSYLLEKSRVALQMEGERNFHIFYQLMHAPQDLKDELYLTQAQDYNLINKTNPIIEGLDDGKEFEDCIAGMEKLNFSEDEQRSIFRIVAGVLHLGNLEFEPSDDGNGSKVSNSDTLDVASHLLGVRSDMLRENLISRRFQSAGRSSAYCVPLDVEKANDSRDSLCQTLYGFMFTWIVKKINNVLSSALNEDSNTVVIGVLDIFGFEIFEKNSFEQLCINFANEKLQQHFNSHTFKLEEEVYKSENINFQHVEFIDNQSVLDLIEKKPNGLLCLLDEEVVMPKATDYTFINKLDQNHGQKKNARYKQNLRANNKFTVVHYAGDVEYQVEGFIDKNKDTLYEGLVELMTISEDKFISTLFTQAMSAGSEGGGGRGKRGRGGKRGGGRRGGGGGGRRGGSKSRKTTLGGQFKIQLNKLMDTLNATNPHYIRCVKPNETKLPASESFTGINVLRQLRYAGVFEAVEIRQTGYPYRKTHEDFYKHYKALVREDNIVINGNNYKPACAKIIEKMAQSKNMDDVQIGNTMILYRALQHRDMELLKNVACESAIKVIQAYNRGWRDRMLFVRMNYIRDELRNAIQTRDLDTLEQAIALSDREADFEIVPEYQNTVSLRDIVKEEIRVTTVLADVLAMLDGNKDPPEDQRDQLIEIVNAARAINFESPDALAAYSLYEEVTQRIKAREDLVAGVEEADEGKLKEAVALAQKLGFPQSDPTVQAAKAELDRIETEKEYIQRLRAALSLPPQGEASEQDMSYTPRFMNQLISITDEGEVILYEGAWEELEASVVDSQNFGCRTIEGLKLVDTGNLILHIRSAIGQEDWDNVETLLIENNHGDAENLYNCVEIKCAKDQLILRGKKAEVQEGLDGAAAAFDHSTLRMYIDKGTALRMDIDWYKNLHEHILATQEALKKGITEVTEELLFDALALGDEIGYNLDDYFQGKELHELLIALREELDELHRLMPDRDVLQEFFDRASEVGMHTEPLSLLENILSFGEEDLAKYQLKNALGRDDKERIIELNIRLKEIFFQLFGQSFVLTQCGKIKTPQEFCKGKLFGKDKLKMGMMLWSKSSIHTSLTRVNKMYEKEATLCFKNILGFMGDKVMSFPNMLAREILEKGIQIPDIRDEIYVQIIKQITQNPNSESKNKGWKLLKLCLKCFPPSTEFENYLEIYFRNKDSSNENEYRILLHQIVYSGPVASPPSPEEIGSI